MRGLIFGKNRNALPFCVQAPIRLIMFLCLPISFIVSISDKRSANSFSVASAVNYNIQRQKYYYRFSFGSNKKLEVICC